MSTLCVSCCCFLLILFSISMYSMCAMLCLFSALSRRVEALYKFHYCYNYLQVSKTSGEFLLLLLVKWPVKDWLRHVAQIALFEGVEKQNKADIKVRCRIAGSCQSTWSCMCSDWLQAAKRESCSLTDVGSPQKEPYWCSASAVLHLGDV